MMVTGLVNSYITGNLSFYLSDHVATAKLIYYQSLKIISLYLVYLSGQL